MAQKVASSRVIGPRTNIAVRLGHKHPFALRQIARMGAKMIRKRSDERATMIESGSRGQRDFVRTGASHPDITCDNAAVTSGKSKDTAAVPDTIKNALQRLGREPATNGISLDEWSKRRCASVSPDGKSIMTSVAVGWEAPPLVGPPGPQAELALAELDDCEAQSGAGIEREHVSIEYAHLAHRAKQLGFSLLTMSSRVDELRRVEPVDHARLADYQRRIDAVYKAYLGQRDDDRVIREAFVRALEWVSRNYERYREGWDVSLRVRRIALEDPAFLEWKSKHEAAMATEAYRLASDKQFMAATRRAVSTLSDEERRAYDFVEDLRRSQHPTRPVDHLFIWRPGMLARRVFELEFPRLGSQLHEADWQVAVDAWKKRAGAPRKATRDRVPKGTLSKWKVLEVLTRKAFGLRRITSAQMKDLASAALRREIGGLHEPP